VIIVYGVLVLAFGLGALLLPMLATLTATLTFGGLLFGSGVVGLIALVFDWRAKGFVWRLLWALIATLGGICIFFHPWEGAYTLTLVLAAILVAQGLVSLAHALTHRHSPGCPWGWMAFGGAVTSLLGGLLIWWLPHAGMMIPGLFLAVSLLSFGFSLVGLGFSHKRSA
jgi:uncharacterized membrane protein HdeD (DUF308 family)